MTAIDPSCRKHGAERRLWAALPRGKWPAAGPLSADQPGSGGGCEPMGVCNGCLQKQPVFAITSDRKITCLHPKLFFCCRRRLRAQACRADRYCLPDGVERRAEQQQFPDLNIDRQHRKRQPKPSAHDCLLGVGLVAGETGSQLEQIHYWPCRRGL